MYKTQFDHVLVTPKMGKVFTCRLHLRSQKMTTKTSGSLQKISFLAKPFVIDFQSPVYLLPFCGVQ